MWKICMEKWPKKTNQPNKREKTNSTHLIESGQTQTLQSTNSCTHFRVSPLAQTIATHFLRICVIQISWLTKILLIIVVTLVIAAVIFRSTDFGCCTFRQSVFNCFRRIYALAIWLFGRLIWRRLLVRMCTTATTEQFSVVLMYSMDIYTNERARKIVLNMFIACQCLYEFNDFFLCLRQVSV